jgi:ATP-binding cassette subfamily A (ABC1) protein 3
MGHGQVQCCGSSLFLKALYGVGYTLTFTRDLLAAGKPPVPHSPTTTSGGAELQLHVQVQALDHKQEPHLHADPLLTLIKQRLPQAEKLTSIGAELSYRMPLQASRLFPDLFREIDGHRAHYSVVNYAVSVTTLEEVFLVSARRR